jgi:hypothetical protein
MHRTEERELDFCSDCGAEVHVARDRAYALDSERMLCFDCATRRGGAYDEAHDLWVEKPDLAGIASEPPR